MVSTVTESMLEERRLPFFLTDARVDCDRWEVTLPQEFIKLSSTKSAFDEDDDLIKLQAVKQVIELAILLTLTELDAILL